MNDMTTQIDEVLDSFRVLKAHAQQVSKEISTAYMGEEARWAEPFPMYYGDMDINKIEENARRFITKVVQQSMPNVTIDDTAAARVFAGKPFNAAGYLQYLQETYADQDSHALKQITHKVKEMRPRIQRGASWYSKYDVETPEEWPRRGKQTIMVRTWGYESNRHEYLEAFAKYCNIVLLGVAPATASSECPRILGTTLYKNGGAAVKFDTKEAADKMIEAVLALE